MLLDPSICNGGAAANSQHGTNLDGNEGFNTLSTFLDQAAKQYDPCRDRTPRRLPVRLPVEGARVSHYSLTKLMGSESGQAALTPQQVDEQVSKLITAAQRAACRRVSRTSAPNPDPPSKRCLHHAAGRRPPGLGDGPQRFRRLRDCPGQDDRNACRPKKTGGTPALLRVVVEAGGTKIRTGRRDKPLISAYSPVGATIFTLALRELGKRLSIPIEVTQITASESKSVQQAANDAVGLKGVGLRSLSRGKQAGPMARCASA